MIAKCDRCYKPLNEDYLYSYENATDGKVEYLCKYCLSQIYEKTIYGYSEKANKDY